jgi:hypothetical protein
MLHRPVTRSATTLLAISALARAAPAQHATPPPTLPAYRTPVIALVQPTAGAPVPQDKPVVVFRFTAGEMTDPIDARTLAVSVDGQDRTALFQMSATEAWGPLAAAGETIALGAHQIVARICSARGACTATTALVTVGQAIGAGGTAADPKSTRKKKVVNALLGTVRTLLNQ